MKMNYLLSEVGTYIRERIDLVYMLSYAFEWRNKMKRDFRGIFYYRVYTVLRSRKRKKKKSRAGIIMKKTDRRTAMCPVRCTRKYGELDYNSIVTMEKRSRVVLLTGDERIKVIYLQYAQRQYRYWVSRQPPAPRIYANCCVSIARVDEQRIRISIVYTYIPT